MRIARRLDQIEVAVGSKEVQVVVTSGKSDEEVLAMKEALEVQGLKCLFVDTGVRRPWEEEHMTDSFAVTPYREG